MCPVNILVCSDNEFIEQELVQIFANDGVRVYTSKHLISGLYSAQPKWDFLILDLNGLNTFLRTVLPVVRRRLPQLPFIGLWTTSILDFSGPGLDAGL